MMENDNGKKRSREDQIAEIERLTGTENITSLIEYLTENPEIPLEEMGNKLREAILLALLTETARRNDSAAICNLVRFLLEQRRMAHDENTPEKAENCSPAEPEIPAAKQECEVAAIETDEPFAEEIADGISKEVSDAVLSFLDDEWPSFRKDK